MSKPIKPVILYKGQPYVDEPVYAEPKPMSELAYSVIRCFNTALETSRRKPKRIQVAWQKVNLNWITRN